MAHNPLKISFPKALPHPLHFNFIPPPNNILGNNHDRIQDDLEFFHFMNCLRKIVFLLQL